MKWIFCRSAFALGLLLASLFVSSLIWAEQPPQRVGSTQRVDTSNLLEIERRVLPECLIAGPNRHESLPEYYWAENPELSANFAEAQRIYEANAVRPFRSMTLVAGAAGVGKTFIKDRVFKKTYAAGDVCKFDIKELYKQWQSSGLTVEKPDLHSGEVVLSRLLAVKDKQKEQPCLIDFLNSKSAAFYVIDSLDEIHPDDYQWVLDQIEQFVFQQDHQFVQVVVFGRGLAFREYWQANRSNREGGPKLFLLHPPKFKTTGDLFVSNWNNDGFRYTLRWSPDGTDPVEMPLATYRTWAETGFPATGDFSSVTFKANDSMNAKTRRILQEWCEQQAVVGPMLYNLAGNGILRDIVEQHAVNGQPFNERRVLETYLSAWMERDSKSNNRPSAAQPENLDLYLQLLQQVAIKPLVENKLDGVGYFDVPSDEVIEINWQGKQLTFPVQQILDRSGLKVDDPRETGTPRYRFEPIWIHRLLVEMHNDQLSQQVSR